MLKDLYFWIGQNSDWIFGGVGVFILSGIVWVLNPFKKTNSQTSSSLNGNSTSVVINNNVNNNQNATAGNGISEKICAHTLDERKNLTKILFIDDDTTFKVVAILKKSGWKNTKIKKDAKGPDDSDIQNADICFIDVLGVASEMFEKDQGLGLVGAIKDKYPKKKVVVYSSQSEGNVFNELWNKADSKLPKNAVPYQFLNLVENFSEEIYC